MSISRLNQYQLLAGPYRMAVWSMLTRFKTEFIRQTADSFKALSEDAQRACAREGLRGVKEAQAWLAANRGNYLEWLTASLDGLIADQTLPDSDVLAEQRLAQIETYLAGLRTDWQRLHDQPSFRLAFRAFAQSIWPYYCVTYPTWLNVDMGGLNFCTWVPDSDLLGEVCFPAIASRKAPTETCNPTLRLCPSLDPCFDQPDTEALKSVLDTASVHQLDFEHIEENLGHVQRLTDSARVHRTDKIFARMAEEGMRHESSPFTDLFHFNAATYRYLLKGTEKENEPVGVLFLASPAMECFNAIAMTGAKAELRHRVPDAWAAAGGAIFAKTMHRDFVGLRKEFDTLDQSARAAVFGDVSHNLKNVLVSIAGLMRLVQDPDVPEKRRRRLSQIAEYVSTYAGEEFGLKSSEIQMHDVRRLFERLTDYELLRLVKLDFKRQLIVRQAIDSNKGRDYVFNGELIDFEAMPIDRVMRDMRDHLISIYRRIGEKGRADKLDNMIVLRLEKDTLGLAIAIICREIVDNMRPREQSPSKSTLEVSFEPGVFQDQRSKQWRSMRISQRLSGSRKENPFEGADKAESVLRFNSRFADRTTGIASMHCDVVQDVSSSQWVLKKLLSFPPNN